MAATLLWDAGPGEVRTGLLEDGALTEFRLIRLRRQSALYAAGELYTARVLSSMARARTRVTLGGMQEAILEAASGLNTGALLSVKMRRAPVPEPGRWKLPVVRPAPEVAAQAEAGWHFSAEPWEIFLRSAASRVESIICPDLQTVREVSELLRPAKLSIEVEPRAIDDADFDSLIEQAVSGVFPIANGMISIERTRAMTMIDIDGDGDPMALNRSAADEIPRLLRLMDIGGPIGIDFLTMADKAQRQEIDRRLDLACQQLGAFERTAINGFGLAQIIRPRTGPSIAEILCETTPGRLSRESRAIALLRAARRAVGHGPRRLVAHPAIIETIKQWPEETLALSHALGVAVELIPDPAATGYGHVHVKPN